MTSRSKRRAWNIAAFTVMLGVLLGLYGLVIAAVGIALTGIDWWVRAAAGIGAVWVLQWAVGKWLMQPMFQLLWWSEARGPGLLRRGVPPEQIGDPTSSE